MRTVLNTIAIVLLSFIFVLGCKKDETSHSNEKEITSFIFEAKNNEGVLSADVGGDISGTEITVTVPYGIDPSLISSLTPSIEVSEQASVSPESGKPQNFTSPVSYTVTAGDGSRQDYTVNVTSAPSFSVSSYYEGENRIGAGDFKKPDLFEISDIVVDGLYTYSLKIAGKDAKEGTITIEEGKAIIYVNLPNAFWNSINDGDITIELTILNDVFSYSTTKEQYNIRSWQDLQGMQYNLEGDYILMNDISLPQHSTDGDFPEVLPEEGFKPVGSGNNKFEGSFKGNGYMLKNFFINRKDNSYIGLFGYANDAIIENVGIEVASMKGKKYVGGLVGYSNNSSTITNSYVTGGSVEKSGESGDYIYVGGLVGYSNNSSTITNSYVTGGSVKGSGYSDVNVGGLVGGYNNSTIENSYVTGGSVEGSGNRYVYVGGLVGYSSSGIIENSCVTGSVSLNRGGGTHFYVGGLVGYIGNNSTIENSYVTGSVSQNANGTNSYVGGLVGYSSSGTIDNSYATGSVSQNANGTNSYVGGLVGYSSSGGIIKNNYATGSVSQNANGTNIYVGGLIGYVSNTGNITYSYWDISSTGQGNSAGGNQVVGVSSGSNLEQRGINDYIDTENGDNRVFIEWEFGAGTNRNIWKFSNGSWPVLHWVDN